MARHLDWVILRPSVILGRAAYGGSLCSLVLQPCRCALGEHYHFRLQCGDWNVDCAKTVDGPAWAHAQDLARAHAQRGRPCQFSMVADASLLDPQICAHCWSGCPARDWRWHSLLYAARASDR